MRLTVCVCLLLLVVSSQAEFDKNTSLKTEKREENAGLKKRAPELSTAGSSLNAGIEYADTNQPLPDKSPSQRIYATPVPQIAKISDLLAGQNPSFQAAIANQLYAPISAYQPRSGSPTTYEVSEPVPSQLAYSEHRLAYQQPNSLQFTPQVYNQKAPAQLDYLQQQILAQPQQIYSQEPVQQIYEQAPQANYQTQPITYNQVQPVQYTAQLQKKLENQQTFQAAQYQKAQNAIYSDNQQNLLSNQYNQAPQVFYTDGQQQYQQQAYVQDQPVQNVQLGQPGVTYLRPETTQQKVYNQPEQNQVYEKPQFVAQNYQSQPQSPVSYASFSHNQANPSIINHPFHQQSVQQIQQYTPAQEATNIVSQGNAGQERQLSYLRQTPQHQVQPQVLQPQVQAPVFQQLQPQVQYSPKANPGYKGEPAAAAQSYQRVQYFGKYAQSIFGKSQH
ncbi:unnamed protein product [Parnassius apollo]|uniref:(apollo) hypothetical protein n=1 Tax=Parnassius apollo TaxID=110799 RepID=A0A8S3W0I9_PARAO|nr:unnamed protein product [Parnassius apollo]